MQGPLIAGTLKRITNRLRAENYLRGLSREEFSDRAAILLVELNGVHPFREGNGRRQRVFIVELARGAGHKLDFSCITRERMIQARIAGNEKNDRAMMQRLFNEIIDPVRVAALRKAIGSSKAQRAQSRAAEQVRNPSIEAASACPFCACSSKAVRPRGRDQRERNLA